MNKELQKPASSVPNLCHYIQLHLADVKTNSRTRLQMLPGSLEGCRQACPRPQSGCSMFRVPGHFLPEMTRIGQDGFVDWSCHFLETFNYNQSYQTRKLNVLAAITDVASQFVLFLRRKFQVPVFQAPAVDLPIPPVHGFGSRRSSVWTPTSSSTMNVPEKPPLRSKKSIAGALGERRGAEPDIAANGGGCVVTKIRR